MNTTESITTVMEAKTAINDAMHTINQRLKQIERELRYMPTVQGCNNAWLEAVDIEKETENMKNMIDQLTTIVNKGK